MVTGVAILLALSAGHFVQNTGPSVQPVQTVQKAAVVSVPAPRFELSKITPLAAPLGDSQAQVFSASALLNPVALPDDPANPTTLDAPESQDMTAVIDAHDQRQMHVGKTGQGLNQYGMPCETLFDAEPVEAGMVAITVASSCRTDQRVEIVHDRLTFASLLSNTGKLSLTAPALDPSATYLVRFEDGQVMRRHIDVPEARDFERVALMWRGDQNMQLHAFEFGAGFQDDGHVWAGHSRDAAFAIGNKGGFMTVLGDVNAVPPQMAEVYSFPRGESAASNVVRVAIEVEVTGNNCNSQIYAETIQPGADGQLQSAEIEMSVPDCASVGEFLVLKNAVRDLKIARN